MSEQFTLNVEEATAVLSMDMGVPITPHMQSLLDIVQERAIANGRSAIQVIAQASLKKGVLAGLSFDEEYFRNRV